MKNYTFWSWIVSLSLGASLVGCGEGRPWAVAQLEVESSLKAGSVKLDADQTFCLSETDCYQVRSVAMTLCTAQFLKGQTGTTTVAENHGAFDPSDPPAPYTNCHAGHCHIIGGDDVISYEAIEAELFGQDASTKGTQVVSTRSPEIRVELMPVNHLTVESIDMGDLELGEITRLSLILEDFYVELVQLSTGETLVWGGEDHEHGDEGAESHEHDHGDEGAFEVVAPLMLDITMDSDYEQTVVAQLIVKTDFLAALVHEPDQSVAELIQAWTTLEVAP